jgi:putative MATE family efflux protein|tara:strand:- start:2660 stop:4012 length:1353 start_codon:yes stop_codon:yes gene_type:complete
MNNNQSPQIQAILSAPILGMLIKFALPNLVGVLSFTVIILMDAGFVAQLGTGALASLAIVFPFQSLMQMMAAGAIGGGIASSVSRALGSGNKQQAEAAAWHGLLIVFVFSTVYSIVLGVFCRPLFSLLGANEEIINDSVLYSRILFGGAISAWLFFMLTSMFRGIGSIHLVSVVMIISSILQITLSGALTLGWGNFPSMGILGPPTATVISQSAATIYMLFIVMNGKRDIRLIPHKFNLGSVYDIMKVGGIGMVNSASTAIGMVIITGIIGRYGTAALAGYGLGNRLEYILIPIAFGVGGVLTPSVGANFGAKQYKRARSIAWHGWTIVFLITGSIGLITALSPGLWLDWFTTDKDAYVYGAKYLSIAGCFYGLYGGGQTLIFASQGTGNMIIPVSVSVTRLVFVVIASSIAVALSWDVSSIFIIVGLGLAIFGVGLAGNMFSPKWNPRS